MKELVVNRSRCQGGLLFSLVEKSDTVLHAFFLTLVKTNISQLKRLAAVSPRHFFSPFLKCVQHSFWVALTALVIKLTLKWILFN